MARDRFFAGFHSQDVLLDAFEVPDDGINTYACVTVSIECKVSIFDRLHYQTIRQNVLRNRVSFASVEKSIILRRRLERAG